MGALLRMAFIYGSVAKGEDTASSDIDLMIVSDSLTHANVYPALEGTSVELNRKVEPTLYSRGELAERIKSDNSFVRRVLAQPKIWIIGREGELPTG